MSEEPISPETKSRSGFRRLQIATYGLLFIILTLFALIQSRDFLYPIAIATLLAYLVYPLESFLERKGLPRIPATILSLLTLGGIIVSGLYFVGNQISVFVDDFPELEQRALQNVEAINNFILDTFGVSIEEQKSWLRERVSALFDTSSVFFNSAFNSTANTVIVIGLMPVYIFFLLYYRNKARHFVLMLVPERHHRNAEKVLNEVSQVSQYYMSGVFVVVLILCVLNSLGLMIVGVRYPVLLGVISALFNFIPYFGTLIGGAVPLIIAFITADSPNVALGVVILFLIIQFTENNILTPNITGGRVKLNPYATILSLVAGAMVWGIPGMLVIVPYMAMFKIICDHVGTLKPIGFLLGTEGTEKHAVSRENLKKAFNKIKSVFGA